MVVFSVRMEIIGENWRGHARGTYEGIFDGHPALEGVPPEDRRRILQRVRREQADRYIRNIGSEGGEYGGWVGGPTYTGLNRTGSMLGYVRRQSFGTVSANTARWIMNNATTGASVWPITHQMGTDNGFGRGIRIPQRKMWDLDAEDEARSEDIITSEVSNLYGF